MRLGSIRRQFVLHLANVRSLAAISSERVTNPNDRDVDEIVAYVDEERAMQQRERRDAPLWTRAKWYVFGRSDEATTD